LVAGIPFIGDYSSTDILPLLIELETPSSIPGTGEALRSLTHDLNLFGWDILVLGEQSGTAPAVLSESGARLTTLECLPLPRPNPEPPGVNLQRIGGLSRCLPFADASFDAVSFNAASPLIRDVPASLHEALRVLRPGGRLLVFGSVPTILSNLPGAVARTIEVESLGLASAARIRTKGRWTQSAPVQNRQDLIPASNLHPVSSMALIRLIPAHYVDLPFPGRTPNSLESTQGWLPPEADQPFRRAHASARWFLRRPAHSCTLVFDLTSENAPQAIDLILDGQPVQNITCAAGTFITCNVDVSAVPPLAVFSLAMRSVPTGDFAVMNRRWLPPATPSPAPTQPSVFVVIPVFNRLHFTRSCIADLKAQTHQPLIIIVADGGSTDGTPDILRQAHPDIHVLISPEEQWWAGSVHQGIAHALTLSTHEDDLVLMMNNDTRLPPDYVGTLVAVSREQNAAVGALIVDSRDPTRSLDAGEYMDWKNYDFPLKSAPRAGEILCPDVDFLPGRGSLVPLRMTRQSGNIDARLLPHYLADYEFFYRLKTAGHRLCVTYTTRIEAHIEETGILPGAGAASFGTLYRECFSRRSMNNVIDHWCFVSRHAPPAYRARLHRRFIARVFLDFTMRSPLRPILWPPFSWTRRHLRAWGRYFSAWAKDGRDVLCRPKQAPVLIRFITYLLASPAPFTHQTLGDHGLDRDSLLARNLIQRLKLPGWYEFATLRFADQPEAKKLRRLFRFAWSPLRKLQQARAWQRDMRQSKPANFTLAIELIDDPSWMGGTLYTRNLAKALARLPEDLRPRLRLLGTPAAIAKTQSEQTIEVAPPHELIDLVYPGLGAPIPGAVTMRWVPDFQHRHLPALFSAEEIELRDRTIGGLAATPGFIVFSSATAARDFIRFYPEAKATPRVWHFRSAFGALPAPRDPRPHYSLPDKYLYLPNQFWVHKNHRVVFEALAHLKKTTGLVIPLVCTGSFNDSRNPEHHPGLLRFLSENELNDQILLLGLINRNDQIEIFRHAAAVVQPSLFEGWSTVVEDTRSIGRPLILSDIPVHCEQAPPGSVLFNPSSPLALATLLAEHWPRLVPGPDLNAERNAAADYLKLVDTSARIFCDIALAALEQRKARQ
jgi:GT2 family glycosyltransferase/glycosyltransferase involved in cell wall biosynthesis/SAM-dependent methyltransferase